MPDQERRKELSYDVALARLAKNVCPGCERPVDLKNDKIDFCPHCGIGLFDRCGPCGTRKSAFARFCHACGASSQGAAPAPTLADISTRYRGHWRYGVPPRVPGFTPTSTSLQEHLWVSFPIFLPRFSRRPMRLKWWWPHRLPPRPPQGRLPHPLHRPPSRWVTWPPSWMPCPVPRG